VKQVSPRTNVEEFIDQGNQGNHVNQGMTPWIVFWATMHVGGKGEKKVFLFFHFLGIHESDSSRRQPKSVPYTWPP
jgi:hypothetical protein